MNKKKLDRIEEVIVEWKDAFGFTSEPRMLTNEDYRKLAQAIVDLFKEGE